MKLRAQILTIIGLFVLAVVVLPDVELAQVPVKRDVRKAKQIRDQADRLYRQKNYQEAIAQYAAAIELDPTNAEGHYWKGYAHQYIKEYDEAVAELTKALELGYKPLDVHRIRGYVNYEKKDFAAADADFNEVLRAEPNNVLYLRASAEVNYELKSYSEALAAYEKLVAANPKDGNLYYSIARIYADTGNVEGQASAAEAAIRNNTQNLADAQLLAGDANFKLGRFQQAEQAYLKSLDSRPDNREVYRTLADLYRSQARYDDAIAITRRAIRLYPNDGDFFTDNSWYYSLAGRHEEAIQAAQAGIQFRPNQYMAYTNLCRAYNDVKKPELAISACNNALRLKPDDGETYFYLGFANDLLNKPNEATKFYKRAVTGLVEFTRVNPGYSDGYYLLGNAYFADNQLDKAIEAYKKVLEMSPRFARARYNMAVVQLQRNNKAAATEQYNILIGMDKDLSAKLKAQIDKAN